jgi:cellulase/cellobiase CelA1
MNQQAQRTICAPFYHYSCGTLKSGETSTNKFFSEQFVALSANPFPGAGSSTPYSSSNYTPKFVGNLANYGAIVNKSWPFGLFFFDATIFSEPLNMRGGFPG